MTTRIPAKAVFVFALMVLGSSLITASDDAAASDSAEFLAPHSAVPVDTDSDSIYELVNVYAGVRVANASYYIVEARFFQPLAIWMANSTNITFMTPGDHSVETIFYGSDLYDDHLNGTYYVDLRLYQGRDIYNSTLIATTTFIAGDFTYDEFDDEFAEPTHFEMISDSGYDSDGDGLYNYLQINVNVYIAANPDWIRVQGTIDGIGHAAGDPTLISGGIYSVFLRFDGEVIRNKTANGPYRVQLDLVDARLAVICSAEYRTSNYSWSEFSNSFPEAPIRFAPPHSGSPVDTDSDSLYEIFTVNVSVNVTEPGWYHVIGFLYTPSTYWTSGVWVTELGLYEVGTGVAVLRFTSFYIRAYGLDGTFIVNLQLSSQNSTKFASMDWTLGNYSGASFDFAQPSHIEGVLGDSGLDTNGDAKFEYLVISVQVHIIDDGFYGLSSWIPGLTDDSTGPIRVVANLTAGIYTIDLRYRGDFIANAAMDGPYVVEIALSDGSFNPYFGFFDAVSYTTHSYTYSQFQATAGASFVSHSDESLDVNGDGAQEYLAVYVNLYVDVPGTYNISGRLSVLVGFIETVWNRTFLGAGDRTVTLLFPGDIIKASKWNGSYLVYLNLSDENGNLLWSPVYFTNFYTWVVFAKPPVAAAVAEQLEDAGRNYTLNASVSYVEAVIFEVRWDFNSDGVWDTGWSAVTAVLYEFPGPGNYTVTVEVRDVRGLTDLFSILVFVPPEGVRPPSHLVADSFLPEIVLAVGIIGVIGTVAMFMAWPIESLVVAFLALLLPLYSRLRKDDVLDNYRRGMIHGLILAHPGISFTGLKDALAFSSGSLVYHLSILQEKGQVCCRKSGTLMRYYLDGSPISHVVRLGLTDFQLEIVKHVLSRGETSKRDLQIAVKSSKQTLHYNLKKLVTDGILVSSFSGGHRTYSIASGIEPNLSRALEVEDTAAYAHEGSNALQTEDSSSKTIEG